MKFGFNATRLNGIDSELNRSSKVTMKFPSHCLSASGLLHVHINDSSVIVVPVNKIATAMNIALVAPLGSTC